MMALMTRIGRLVFLCAIGCVVSAPAMSEPFFDNWNPAACSGTDSATLSLDRATWLQRADIWYLWNPNETSAPYSLSKDGVAMGGGDMSRAECDPNQSAWCVARIELGAQLEPGVYVFRTARRAICQNSGSGGQGFIRAYP